MRPRVRQQTRTDGTTIPAPAGITDTEDSALSHLPGMSPAADCLDDRILAIRDWCNEFETADSRRHKKLKWISEPVNMDSTFWLELTSAHEGHEAAALYGCWVCVCKVAARAPVRGVLQDSRGNAITAIQIATASRLPVDLFRRVMFWAVNRGWLHDAAESTKYVDSQSFEERHTLPDPTQQKTPPPPNQTGAESGTVVEISEDDVWTRLTTRLLGLGLDLAPETLQTARSAGKSPDYVSAVLEHYEAHPGAWQPGAIRMRLTRPGKLLQEPDQGWPPPKSGTGRYSRSGTSETATTSGSTATHQHACQCGHEFVSRLTETGCPQCARICTLLLGRHSTK